MIVLYILIFTDYMLLFDILDRSNCQQSQLMCSYSFRHSSIRSSTPIEEHNGEILALQKEVQKLQAMVHELWLCHQAGLSSGKFVI
jgi:hypothetical protein